MDIKRYESSEAQWSRIAPLVPGKRADPGRTGADNRLFVNVCLWELRSRAHWCDLPERYGKWKTMHRCFSRWCHAGVWKRILEALAADRDNQYRMIDSTFALISKQRAKKGGGAEIRRRGGPEVGWQPRWACQDFCAGGRYRHQMTNRSPKMTAN